MLVCWKMREIKPDYKLGFRFRFKFSKQSGKPSNNIHDDALYSDFHPQRLFLLSQSEINLASNIQYTDVEFNNEILISN